MRLQRTVAVFWCLLAAGLSVGIQAGAALIGKDTTVPAKPKAFSSVALRTPQLTLTGVGVAELTYRFTPVTVRTPPLTLTGVGLAEAVYHFTPVTVRTPPLTVTGTGRSE